MSSINVSSTLSNPRIINHYINGEHTKGASTRLSNVYNPATGKVQA